MNVPAAPLQRLRRDVRGAVVIEMAVLVTVIVTALSAMLDIYRYQRAQSGAARLATFLADYTANHPAELRRPALDAFADATRNVYLADADHQMVVRVLHLHQGPGSADTPRVPWMVVLSYGTDTAALATLQARCPPPNRGLHEFAPGRRNEFLSSATPVSASLPGALTLAGGADLVVVELCARLRSGLATRILFDETIYRASAMPFVAPDTRPVDAPST